MKDFSGSPHPLSIARPRGARLLQARSPKLGRHVQHHDYPNFRQWICLEADPTVSTFCERPARLGAQPISQIISFWVSRKQSSEFLMVSLGTESNLPSEHDGKPLRAITPDQLSAAAVWIDNWQRMLGVLNCSASLVPPDLSRSILKAVKSPISMMAIESAFPKAHPVLVRAAIFELLRTGKLCAPSLHTEQLNLHIVLEPAT